MNVIKIKLEPQGKELQMPGPRPVGRLLKELDIVPGTVLVIRDETLLTEDEIVTGGEEIEIRSVISGGNS